MRYDLRTYFYYLLLLCVAVMGGGCHGRLPDGEGAASNSPVVLLAVGDSTCVGLGAQSGEGYAERLFRRLRQRRPEARLVKLCVVGATTEEIVGRVAACRPDDCPTLVTVSLGVNDLLQGVPPERFAANYEELIARLRARRAPAIVVTNLPDVSAAPLVAASERAELGARLRLYNEAVESLARRHGLTLVDLHGAAGAEVPTRRAGFVSADGMHPSDAGYEFWAEVMWPAVERAVGG